MARILPPTIYRAEFTAPKVTRTPGERLSEQWLSPEGVTAAVNLTDVVGGTVADVVERYNRKSEELKAGRELIDYNEALARVAGAKTHLQRQRAYERMGQAWNRPGSGRLSKRWSGGPEETATTQYKRMLSPLRYPKTGGSGRGKDPGINYRVLQDLQKQIADPGSAVGRQAITLGFLEAGGATGRMPDIGKLDPAIWVPDAGATYGVRLRLPNEEKILNQMVPGSEEEKNFLLNSRAQADTIAALALQMEQDPTALGAARDSVGRVRRVISIGSQAALRPTRENLAAYDLLVRDPRYGGFLLPGQAYGDAMPSQYAVGGNAQGNQQTVVSNTGIASVPQSDAGLMSTQPNQTVDTGQSAPAPTGAVAQSTQPTDSTPVGEAATRSTALVSGIVKPSQPDWAKIEETNREAAQEAAFDELRGNQTEPLVAPAQSLPPETLVTPVPMSSQAPVPQPAPGGMSAPRSRSMPRPAWLTAPGSAGQQAKKKRKKKKVSARSEAASRKVKAAKRKKPEPTKSRTLQEQQADAAAREPRARGSFLPERKRRETVGGYKVVRKSKKTKKQKAIFNFIRQTPKLKFAKNKKLRRDFFDFAMKNGLEQAKVKFGFAQARR